MYVKQTQQLTVENEDHASQDKFLIFNHFAVAELSEGFGASTTLDGCPVNALTMFNSVVSEIFFKARSVKNA